jgi:WD repeat-containing protein 61
MSKSENLSIQKVNEFLGHKGAVFSIDYNSETKSLYSGGADGFIAKWLPNVSTDGKLIMNTNKPIWSFCVDYEQNHLIVGTSSGNIHIADMVSSNELRNISIHSLGVFTVVKDKNRFLTGGGDGFVNLWDENWQLISKKKLSTKNIRQILKIEKNNEYWVACSDNNIYVLNLNLEIIHILESHTFAVFALAYQSKLGIVASGGRDALLKIWNSDTKELMQTINAHWLHIHALAFSPCGKYLASSSMDKTIKIWNSSSLDLIKVIDFERYGAHSNCVNKVLWIDSNNLISCSDDRRIIHFLIDKK